MSSVSNRIGEKVSSLYDAMEYNPEYNIQQFKHDLEELKTVSFSVGYQRRDMNSHWPRCLARFREALENHRSILTKLFSFTNNLNSVDTLINYCDYYKAQLEDVETDFKSDFDVDLEGDLLKVFLLMTKNEKTKDVLWDVWDLLCQHAVSSPFYCHDRNFCAAITGPSAMVIMADADLSAAVQALISSQHTYFQVSKVVVQEPIKEELLRIVRSYDCNEINLSDLYVFRNTSEALGCLNSNIGFKDMSVWSENIIAAKKFTANSKINTTWINAHGELGAGLHSITYCLEKEYINFLWSSRMDSKSAATPVKTLKTWNLFYGGQWRSPADKKYWTNCDGVSFAQATGKDIVNCATAAREAFKLWRSTKLSKRIKIIRSFADRLRANGDSEFADTVLRFVDLPYEFGTSLSIVRDGEAEISTTSEPIGVVLILSEDQKILFIQLIIACVTGNAVILILNSKSSVSFAPYCDLLGTCGIPPGVISCLFTSDSCFDLEDNTCHIDQMLVNRYKIEEAKLSCRRIFLRVTRPKSVWLQCA